MENVRNSSVFIYRDPEVGLVFSMNYRNSSKLRLQLFNQSKVGAKPGISAGDLVWLIHTESKSYLQSLDDQLLYTVQSNPAKRKLSGIWSLESAELGRGGPVSFTTPFRLFNLTTGKHLVLSREPGAEHGQLGFQRERTEAGLFRALSLDKFDTQQVGPQSYFYLQGVESECFVGQTEQAGLRDEVTVATHCPISRLTKDLFRVERLSITSSWETNKVFRIKQFLGMYRGRLAKASSQEIAALGRMLEEMIVLTYNTESLEDFLGNISSDSNQLISAKLFYNGVPELLCQLLLELAGLPDSKALRVAALVFDQLRQFASMGLREKEVCFSFRDSYLPFLGRSQDCLLTLIEVVRESDQIKKDLHLVNYGGQPLLDAILNCLPSVRQRHLCLRFLNEIVVQGGQGISVNQLCVANHVFAEGRFRLFFSAYSQERGRITADGVRLGQKGVSQTLVIQQIELLANLCINRNYSSIAKVSAVFSCQSLLACVKDESVPRGLRGVLLKMLTVVYLDVSPHFSSCSDGLTFFPQQSYSRKESVEQRLERSARAELLAHSDDPFLPSSHLDQRPKESVVDGPNVLGEINSFIKYFFKEPLVLDSLTLQLLEAVELLLNFQQLEHSSMDELLRFLLLLLLDDKQEELRRLRQNQFYGKNDQKLIMKVLREKQLTRSKGEIHRKKVEEQPQLFEESHFFVASLFFRKKVLIHLEKLGFLKSFASEAEEDRNRIKNFTLIGRVLEWKLRLRYKAFAEDFLLREGHLSALEEYLPPLVGVVPQVSDDPFKAPLFIILVTQFMSSKNKDISISAINLLLRIYRFRESFCSKISKTLVLGDPPDLDLHSELLRAGLALQHLSQTSEVWFTQELLLKGNKPGSQSTRVKGLLDWAVGQLCPTYEGPPHQLFFRAQFAKVSLQRQAMFRSAGLHRVVADFLGQSFFFLQALRDSDGVQRQMGEGLFSLCFQFLHGFVINNKVNKAELKAELTSLFRYLGLQEVGQAIFLGEFYCHQEKAIRDVPQARLIFVGEALAQKHPPLNYYIFMLKVTQDRRAIVHKNLTPALRSLSSTEALSNCLRVEQVSDGRVAKYQYRLPLRQHQVLALKLVNRILKQHPDALDLLRPKLIDIFSLSHLLGLLASPALPLQFKSQLADLVRTAFLKREQLLLGLHSGEPFKQLVEYSEHFKEERFQEDDKLAAKAIGSSASRAQFLYKIRAIVEGVGRPNGVQLGQTKAKAIAKQDPQFDFDYPLKETVGQSSEPWITRCAQIFLSEQMQRIVSSQSQQLADNIVGLQRINADPVFLRALLDSSLPESSSPRTVSQTQFFSKLVQIAVEETSAMKTGNSSGESLSSLLQLCLLVLGQENISRTRLVDELENNFIEESLRLLCWDGFRLSSELHERIFRQVIGIYLVMIETNDSERYFYRELVLRRSSDFSSERFFVLLRAVLYEELARVEAAQAQDAVVVALQEAEGRVAANNSPSVFSQVLKLIMALNENEQDLPFSDFFRFQPSFMVTTDFLLLGLRVLRSLAYRGNTLQLHVLRLRGIREVSLFLISFLRGPNLKNQRSLVESSLSELVFEVMRNETYENNPAPEPELEAMVAELRPQLQLMGLWTEFNLALQKQRTFQQAHYNVLKLYLCKILEGLSEGLDPVILGKIKSSLPFEYLIVNIIWVYDLFLEEEGLKYREELLVEPQEDALAVPTARKLVLQVGFLLYPFVHEYQKLLQVEPVGSSQSEEGYTKVLSVLFSRLLGKNEVGLKLEDGYESQLESYKRTYQGACEFFSQYSIHVEIAVGDKVFDRYFPKLPLCSYLTEEQKDQLKEGAQFSQFQRFNLMIEKFNEISDLLLLELRVRKVFGGLSLSSLPLNYMLMALTCVQLVLLMAEFKDVHVFTMDFETNYIVPLATYSGAYATLVFQILILLVGLLKLLCLLTYSVPLQVLRGRKALAQLTKERLFMSQPPPSLWEQAREYGSKVLQFDILYDATLVVLVLLTVLNPFLVVSLLVDLFSSRYKMIAMVFQAVKRPWRFLLVVNVIWTLTNYVYAYLYYGYSQWMLTGDDACAQIFTCASFIFDQSYRNDEGFLSYLVSSNNIYFSFPPEQFNFTFQILIDFSFIVMVGSVIKSLVGGTIIDTFSDMRNQDAVAQRELRQRCYLCGIEREVLDIEQEGYLPHTLRNHNLWHYVYFLAYLKQKDPRNFTSLQLSFYRALVKDRQFRAFPFRNSVFLYKQAKTKPADSAHKSALQSISQTVRGYRKLLEEVRKRFGQ